MKLTIREMATFSLLGALMFASKMVMDFLPNIHLIGVFVVALTVIYHTKALWPIYVFVFITGLLNGFSLWWVPYLYIWTVLWAAVMLLPKNCKPIFYTIVCSLHGFLYGTLYAPFQAVAYGLNLKQTIAWIVAGLPFDAIHGISNFICGLLIVPVIKAIGNNANHSYHCAKNE